MHLTIVVPLSVTVCYSSAFDFDNYNIQWDVTMPGSKVQDFPLSEELNLSEPTSVLPVLTLVDLNLTSVDQAMVDNLADDCGVNLTDLIVEWSTNLTVDHDLNLTELTVDDNSLNLTNASIANVDLSSAQLTFTSNLSFPNNTLDDLVDEASDLADQAINARSKADPDVGPHPLYLSTWGRPSNFMEAEGGLAVLFTVISTSQFAHKFSISPWIFAISWYYRDWLLATYKKELISYITMYFCK